MKSIESYREKINKEYPRAWYSNLIHFPLFFIALSGIIWSGSLLLGSLSLWNWLMIPYAFIVSNLVEYLMHRFPMHRPYKYIKKIYKKHTIDHHLYFQSDHMYVKNWTDFSAIPAPWETAATFLLFIALPLSGLHAAILGINAGIIFGMTACSYYLFYEIMHMLIHISPWLNERIGKPHTVHHRLRDMRFYNFNVFFPIMDILFRTYKRE